MLNSIKRQVRRIIKPPFINYIDVGAAGRLQNPWKRYQNRIHHWLRFEPNESGLTRDGTQISMDVAIWDRQESRNFYVMGAKGHGSSLLEPNIDYVRENYEALRQNGDPDLAANWFERAQISDQHTIKTRTLDDVLDELAQHNLYHFLKTDTQGADYYVFKGAEQFLQSSCIAIQSEQFVYPLYKDSMLLDETSEYLANFGFALVKKFAAHGTFNSQHDVLYMKTDVNNKQAQFIRSIYQLD